MSLAAPAAPRRVFRLPDDWPALRGRLGAIAESGPLCEILALAENHAATRAILEPEYIDSDYRSEYTHFYATTFRKMSDRCSRLHFLRGNSYLGFVSLRPLKTRPVSRTFIAPPEKIRDRVSCLADAVARPYGRRYTASAFPFMEQDYQLGVCAHASIWMVALYHHLVYQTPRYHMADIARAAGTRGELVRVVPSDGLTVEQVATAFRELGLPAVIYSEDKPPAGETMESVACRYLNSRLPVAVANDEHITVLIGYGREPDGRLFFIRADDTCGPYERVHEDDDEHGPWRVMLIPVPGRIYLAGEGAEIYGRFLFEELLADDVQPLAARLADGSVRLRTYAIRAGEYKLQLRARGLAPLVVTGHARVSTSNWIWIVELQDRAAARDGRRCVIGELAIDATSDRLEPNPLFANLPGKRWVWGGGIDERQAYATPKGELYLTGTALHDRGGGTDAEPHSRFQAIRDWWSRRRSNGSDAGAR